MKRCIAGALALTLLLGACSKATPDNYAKVSTGMSRQAVYEVLGKPDEVSGGSVFSLEISSETWKGPSHTIVISFAGDRVASKTIQAGDDKP